MRCLIAILMFICSVWVVAQPQTTTCKSDNHHAFDFWLGDWRVTSADGKHAGDNTVEKIQGGCIVRENWRSATSGFSGTSFSFYNPSTEKWEQLWLDNQGNNLHMRGDATANEVVLNTDTFKNSTGQSAYNQITWTANEDGSVRQHWVLVTEGENSKTIFDGLYTKRQ